MAATLENQRKTNMSSNTFRSLTMAGLAFGLCTLSVKATAQQIYNYSNPTACGAANATAPINTGWVKDLGRPPLAYRALVSNTQSGQTSSTSTLMWSICGMLLSESTCSCTGGATIGSSASSNNYGQFADSAYVDVLTVGAQPGVTNPVSVTLSIGLVSPLITTFSSQLAIGQESTAGMMGELDIAINGNSQGGQTLYISQGYNGTLQLPTVNSASVVLQCNVGDKISIKGRLRALAQVSSGLGQNASTQHASASGELKTSTSVSNSKCYLVSASGRVY